MDINVTNKLRVIGNPQDVKKFGEAITPYNYFDGYQEAHIRTIIQGILDDPKNRLRQLTVLYDGNTVWSKDKILKDVRTIVKSNDMSKMTNHLYDFLNLCCGSIAHYNKQGWIEVYPTVSHLRQFFSCNEYGGKVINHIPHWKTDVIHIVTGINKLLRIK
jgi:hypothetical protein